MMNYIKSECYRCLKNRNLIFLIVGCAALEALMVFVLAYFGKMPGFRYGNTRFALSNLYGQMGIGLALAVCLAFFMHDNEEKHHTIKHSISFGIARPVIYMGRFLTQVLAGAVIYVLLALLLVILSFAFLEHSNVGEVEMLINISLQGGTCLLAGMAVAHFFAMNFDNQNMMYGASLVILLVLPFICNRLGLKITLFSIISYFFPANLLSSAGPLLSENGSPWHVVLIGMGWVILFLIAGMVKFSRKEIK